MNNSYKFSEIILALRKEYIKNEELLRKLEKCLAVDGNAFVDACVDPSFSMRDYDNIRVYIYEKQSNIKRAIDKIKRDVLSEAPVGEPHRIVKKEKDKYVLGFEDYMFYEGYTSLSKHRLYIINEPLFNKTIEEIVNSDFMKLPDFCDYINPFQYLTINASDVSLSCNFSTIKPHAFPEVSYSIKNDAIWALPYRGGNHIISDILNTRIHKDFIPEEYREIIDKSIVDSKGKISQDISIDSLITRNSELDIVEKLNNYSLVKRRNIRFYE